MGLNKLQDYTKVVELSLAANTDNLDTFLEFIESNFGDLSVAAQTKLLTAADEIFVNICNYAYVPRTGNVIIRVLAEHVVDDKTMFTVEFEDGGVPYNPLEKADPDTSLPADERSEGGLGIFLTKKLMDNVEYRREGNKNILKISKGL
ncbi:MAG: ATP-binding protein [Oscillospiraceae bacterium]|jgi:anti-sigma regulatory factor (Ser/Thr protein kinase)|nr:ATP-binding protein [Oscillospiraceae bacterium]